MNCLQALNKQGRLVLTFVRRNRCGNVAWKAAVRGWPAKEPLGLEKKGENRKSRSFTMSVLKETRGQVSKSKALTGNPEGGLIYGLLGNLYGIPGVRSHSLTRSETASCPWAWPGRKSEPLRSQWSCPGARAAIQATTTSWPPSLGNHHHVLAPQLASSGCSLTSAGHWERVHGGMLRVLVWTS